MAICKGIIFLFVVCLFPSSSGQSVGTTASRSCYHEGKWYDIWETYSPNPCTFCQCDTNGMMACLVGCCVMTPCMDPVTFPDRCCPVCPNGPDCWGRDHGFVASGNRVIYEDTLEECECPMATADVTMYMYQPRPLVCRPFTPPSSTTYGSGDTTAPPPVSVG